jgi:hypothetical protein
MLQGRHTSVPSHKCDVTQACNNIVISRLCRTCWNILATSLIRSTRFTITISISIAQIYMWIWSNALYIKYYTYLITYLAWTFLSLQQLWYYFLNCVYPNPPCQLSLWEETGEPGENPRLSTDRWLTLFTWVRSENRTHELRGERRLLWLRQVVNSLFYTCWQLGTSSANTTCWRLVGRLATRCEIFPLVQSWYNNIVTTLCRNILVISWLYQTC